MRKIFLFAWYLLGIVVSLPALLFLILTNWLGLRAENRFLRNLQQEDVNYDKNKE
jgi:uncharacterized membrane protein YbaN (DUF454 family)